MSSFAATPRDWRIPAGVAALLLLHVTLALWAVAHKSVTADEILHVTGGYFYDRFGDYRVQPENGNLPQRLAGLPAVVLGAKPPPMAGNVYWRTSDAPVISYQFFYESGQDHWPMLMGARAMISLFSAATGLLVFCWARHLSGNAAGFFALTLYVFCPNILAHGALATSDAAAMFFFLAAVSAFWIFLRRLDWRTALLSGMTFGLACVAKYSAVFLLPMMLLLLAWRIALEPAGLRARWWRLAPLVLGVHAVAALAIIWAFYGFRYSAFAPGLPPADQFLADWNRILPFIGFQRPVVEFCRQWHLLPEPFLYGYSWVVWASKARAAFLAGDYGLFGWVSFFPLAFFWKTPVAVLAALALGAVTLGRCWRRVRLTALAPLLVLFAVYWAVSLTSHLNIGHRHLLPVYPVLFIWLGGLLAPGALTGVWRRILPLVFVGGQVVANVRSAPDYLAFFNSFAGGPANGYRLLVDSSLDWGQDLPALADWLRANNSGPPARPVFLSYFGSGEPNYYHITASRMPAVNGFKLPRQWYEPSAGIYCISATMLQHVYASIRNDWNLKCERRYQEGRAKEPLFREYWANARVREELQRLGQAENFETTWKLYDELRFARLCQYLRARRADAMAGYSILIYRLSQAEIDAALNRDLRTLATAIEHAGGPP